MSKHDFRNDTHSWIRASGTHSWIRASVEGGVGDSLLPKRKILSFEIISSQNF